jgi:hypothetical protein
MKYNNWEDMGLFWAWRAKGLPTENPPYTKEIVYADLLYNGKFQHKIAVAVLNDGIRVPMFESKNSKLIEYGLTINYDTGDQTDNYLRGIPIL